MPASTWFTLLGLILDILGALLLWRYGLPPDIRRGGVVHLIAEHTDDAEARKAARFDRLSHVGIALLALGFALQRMGTLCGVLTRA